MDSMRRNAQKMMPHIMAMNKDPNVGMKNNRQPKPGVSNLTAYAKGGKVMAKGGAADKKQDKSMLARHNRLMHPGQKSKLMNGGMVKKYADGGVVKMAKGKKTNQYAKDKDPYASDKTKGLGPMTDKEAKDASKEIAKKYPPKKKPEAPKMDGYKKGGKVKCSPKKKGDKKKVMGTVGEAKALMAALQKARRPATPMPGTRMAGLGMAPPMKHGGKVMKKAAGGAAKLRKS